MSIAPGTKLGQYEVQDFIGQGAMGFVYRAYHSELERTGAVKVMQALTPDADTAARFRHEAQAIAQMRHPNIVNVYDFGAFEGTPYMIVEYVPGGSLAAKMGAGPLDRALALKYLRGIAAGLDYAHGRGVVHRDVKPANVLLTGDDTPVLADFGLAKLMQGSSLKSLTGVTTGTPAYMAPEQVTGSRVGPAADRYSLATIAYEMLTGVIPFDGEGLMELLYAQVHRDPPAPSSRNPSLSPAVDAVILRGLAKDPDARWESSAAFVDALASALTAPAAPIEKTMVMTRPLRAAAPVPAPVAAAPSSVPKRRSRKALVALVAAAVIIALVVGVLALVSLARTPTLSLSSATLAPGEDVVVTANRLPPNVEGQLQLFSVEHDFGFRANAGGSASIDITIPRDIGFGDHLLKLCYSGACHAQTTLHVIERLAAVSPSPSPSPSASPTPATFPPVLSLLKYTVHPGDAETVGGMHFPGSSVTVYFVESKTEQKLGSATVTAGQFVTTVKIPSTAAAGPAAIRACYTGGCAFATISVL